MARSTAARLPDPPPAPRRLASLENAARYMDVGNAATVRRYIAAGKLTGYRLGDRLVRVDLNEIDRMLQPIPAGRADNVVA